MNRIIVALIASAVALTFAACAPKTNVTWQAGFDPSASPIGDGEAGISEIKWKDESGKVDTTWSETLLSQEEKTSAQEVSELIGEGECLDGGEIATIEISTDSSGGVTIADSGNSAELDEGSDVTLVIGSTTKKKK